MKEAWTSEKPGDPASASSLSQGRCYPRLCVREGFLEEGTWQREEQDLPHPDPEGHCAAPRLRLHQQPRGAAHAGAGNQGGDRSRGTGSPGGGGEKPSIRGVRGHSDLGVPLAVGGYPLTPPHTTSSLRLLTWDPQVPGATPGWVALGVHRPSHMVRAAPSLEPVPRAEVLVAQSCPTLCHPYGL